MCWRRAASVGHHHVDAIDRHPQGFGGDLRQDGRRALPDVDPADSDLNPPSGVTSPLPRLHGLSRPL